MALRPIPNEKLRATYNREIATHPHWPKWFDGAMSDPVTRVVIETMYRHAVPAIQRPRAAPQQPVMAPQAGVPYDWGRQANPQRGKPYRDAKSAAANDKDE